jgi:hypothetical protein
MLKRSIRRGAQIEDQYLQTRCGHTRSCIHRVNVWWACSTDILFTTLSLLTNVMDPQGRLGTQFTPTSLLTNMRSCLIHAQRRVRVDKAPVEIELPKTMVKRVLHFRPTQTRTAFGRWVGSSVVERPCRPLLRCDGTRHRRAR